MRGTTAHSSHAKACAGHATRLTCFFPSRFYELTNSLKAQFRIAAPTYLAHLPLSPHTCCITTHDLAATATLFTFSLILLAGAHPSRKYLDTQIADGGHHTNRRRQP